MSKIIAMHAQATVNFLATRDAKRKKLVYCLLNHGLARTKPQLIHCWSDDILVSGNIALANICMIMHDKLSFAQKHVMSTGFACMQVSSSKLLGLDHTQTAFCSKSF